MNSNYRLVAHCKIPLLTEPRPNNPPIEEDQGRIARRRLKSTTLVGRIYYGCFLFFIFIILASCVLKPSNPLTEPKKFAEIYTALQIAAARDSMVVTRIDSILQQHGFSRLEFDEAVAYYNAHAEAWAKVLHHAVARLDSTVRKAAQTDSLAAAVQLHQKDGTQTPKTELPRK